MKIDIAQLEFVDSLLREIVLWLETQMDNEPVITSLYRMDDPGVHGCLPLRGIDIRCLDDEEGANLESMVNSRWQYDPSRPHLKVCMYHDVGRGKHIHLQVHPYTERVRQ